MRIGIFDSGLGGLVIANSIFKKLPEYDYVYLGDTARVPYGNKTQAQILNFTEQALKFLFAQDCKLVIIACNTSSAKALRKIQRNFLPKFYPDRKVLGVIVPTVEAVSKMASSSKQSVGILATKSTVQSHTYKKEIAKINPQIKIIEQGAPKLTTLIEGNNLAASYPSLKIYLKPLLEKGINILVLGCTHYPILSKQITQIIGKKITLVSQTDIIPEKLKNYLQRHPEITKLLTKNKKKIYQVTKVNKSFAQVAEKLFGRKINLIKVNL